MKRSIDAERYMLDVNHSECNIDSTFVTLHDKIHLVWVSTGGQVILGINTRKRNSMMSHELHIIGAFHEIAHKVQFQVPLGQFDCSTTVVRSNTEVRGSSPTGPVRPQPNYLSERHDNLRRPLLGSLLTHLYSTPGRVSSHDQRYAYTKKAIEHQDAVKDRTFGQMERETRTD
ncbi:hypothetical protein KPH14_003061 [Odynerus spinipes]|uniref:Uncharacterized protein n=1 Tax=Odynerus spinipes TaxID=1348599 RepID=A0AAD9VUJ9_9HYME|nr:hypothetical protein KPH14_003061 [Odynerus spinipes]